MTYPGGKAGSGVYQKIINQIPPHDVYIEPFLGDGAILRHIKPARRMIGCDLDPDVAFNWPGPEGDPYVLSRWTAGDIDKGIIKFSDVDKGLTVIHCDALSFLKNYPWTGREFLYCDPPYLMETRSDKRPLYKYEFHSENEHRALLEILIALPCNVAISGYYSSLYNSMLATPCGAGDGWRAINYRTRTRGGKTAIEWLWMNYAQPKRLHDYRYLGENFRERERINRIRRRWLARLGRMDELERYSILSAIEEYSEAGHP